MTGDKFEVIAVKRHHDDRGFFQELGRGEFRQANWSFSKKGVLRGLHYATYPKLVNVVRGMIFDVAVDCRLDSPTYGSIQYAYLDGMMNMVYIPAHFAHGFLALQDSDVIYLQGQEWRKDDDITIRYDTPALNIPWPFTPQIASAKDYNGLGWEDFTWLLKDLAK
jgi:dTDP-4-dehydrorhamnose 3,5-epimerase